MIVENPYTQPHYLTTYFPIKPKLIDLDRRKNGDIYKKPTQYWFLNCEPEQNMCITPLIPVESKTIPSVRNKTKRSLISKQYAHRFIAQYIIESDSKIVE